MEGNETKPLINATNLLYWIDIHMCTHADSNHKKYRKLSENLERKVSKMPERANLYRSHGRLNKCSQMYIKKSEWDINTERIKCFPVSKMIEWNSRWIVPHDSSTDLDSSRTSCNPEIEVTDSGYRLWRDVEVPSEDNSTLPSVTVQAFRCC